MWMVAMLCVMFCLSSGANAYFCGTCLPEERVVEDATPVLHVPQKLRLELEWELDSVASLDEEAEEQLLEIVRAARSELEAAAAHLCGERAGEQQDLLLRLDAAAWQEYRFWNTLLAEKGVCIFFQKQVVLADVVSAREMIRQYSRHVALSLEIRAEIRKFLDILDKLRLEETLLPRRREWEYIRPLLWFKQFCLAAGERDEARALVMLRTCRVQLAAMLKEEDLSQERLLKLLPDFEMHLKTSFLEEGYPYSNPVLPEALCSAERLCELEPIFEVLPPLRKMVTKPMRYSESWTSSTYSLREEEMQVGGCDVCTAFGLHPRKDGGVDFDQYGVPVTESEVRDEIARYAELMKGDYVRLIVEEAADLEHPGVCGMVDYCEQVGAVNLVLAVRKGRAEDEYCDIPAPFIDVVRRVAHPGGKGWVELGFRRDEKPGLKNCWGYADRIRIKTPAGRLLEYQTRNPRRGVLVADAPWSPSGNWLLLPVSLKEGFLLVPVDALDKPDFSWKSATPIRLPHPGVERYSHYGWKSDRHIHLITLQNGLACPVCYCIETGAFDAWDLSSDDE